ncbi:MAG: hypothetical protein WC241_01580 [Candidatus Paceibacterota bacterium]|jgi:hypothetical protein
MKELLKNFFEGIGLFTDYENHVEPEEDVKEGEKIIGEMNELEKGLYSFIDEKEKEHKSLIEQMESAGEAGNHETLEKFSLEHAKNDRVAKLASKIMWASIENRFQTSEEATGTGIRKGFKIVEIFENETPSMSGMMIPGLGMVIAMRR